jgi:integrase
MDNPPQEAQSAYDRLISEWLANHRQPLPTAEGRKQERLAGHEPDEVPGGLSVAELILAFLRHAEEYYRHPADGKPTNELANYRYALRPLNHLYGHTPARKLRPKRLKVVRALMVKGYEHPQYGEQPPLCRKLINARVARIARMYRWAAEEELVPGGVHQRLATVRALQAGRCKARETEKVKPAPPGSVEAILPLVRPHVAAAVRLQLLTGMRSGEVLPLRACDLERGGPVWTYRPVRHKTAHRGRRRVVAIGPKAQLVLREFIKIRCPICGVEGRPPRIGSRDGCLCGPCADGMDEAGVCGPWQRCEAQADRPLFSPADVSAERYEDLRANRKSKVQPSQECRKKAGAKRRPGLVYTPTNYGNAIDRACDKAGVPRFHPHQLRHTFGTLARRAAGLEGAQVALGHAKADTSELYAEADLDLATEVAKRIG